MNIEACFHRSLFATVLCGVLGLGTNASAQALSSPVDLPPAAARSGAPASASGSTGPTSTPTPNGLDFGSGPGYHDPRSPFKPLEEREGVVSWKVLGAVQLVRQDGRIAPKFSVNVTDLRGKKVKVQGFMMPLDPGDKQNHFLLSSVPTTCAFCVPAGPEGLVEIRTRKPVTYTLEPVVVEGVLAVLNDDPYGLYYRIAEATPVASR